MHSAGLLNYFSLWHAGRNGTHYDWVQNDSNLPVSGSDFGQHYSFLQLMAAWFGSSEEVDCLKPVLIWINQWVYSRFLKSPIQSDPIYLPESSGTLRDKQAVHWTYIPDTVYQIVWLIKGLPYLGYFWDFSRCSTQQSGNVHCKLAKLYKGRSIQVLWAYGN